MIEPPPCSAMCRAAHRLPAMTPKRFTAITRSKSDRSFSQEAPERARDAGVVEHDVEPAESGDGEVDQLLDLLRVGHIGPLEGGRLAQRLGQLLALARHPRRR